MKAAEFAAFLRLVHEVHASHILTAAEKVAVVEAAYDEYASRAQPGTFHAIAKRLSALTIQEAHAPRIQADEEKPAPPQEKAGSASRVAPRAGWKNSGLPKNARKV